MPVHIQLKDCGAHQYVDIQFPRDGREDVEIGQIPERFNLAARSCRNTSPRARTSLSVGCIAGAPGAGWRTRLLPLLRAAYLYALPEVRGRDIRGKTLLDDACEDAILDVAVQLDGGSSIATVDAEGSDGTASFSIPVKAPSGGTRCSMG